MGSPNNIDVVTGEAKIRREDISTTEWCEIIRAALREVKHCLKNVSSSDFKPLGELLNGELLTGHGKFATTEDAMPNFEGTDLNHRTRFVALQKWDPPIISGSIPRHEKGWNVLLLTDACNFVILKLSFFRNGNLYTVCSSSLIAYSTAKGYKSVLDVEALEIRDRIDDGSIHPYGILDHLGIVFRGTVSDQEKRLNETRRVRDVLEGMCNRISS